MSQWRCKIDDHEVYPLSFAELAELLRDGKLDQGAKVCRAGSMNWEPAWHVPGLLRAAGITEPGDSAPSEAATVRTKDVRGPVSSQHAGAVFRSMPPGYGPPGVRGKLLTSAGALRGLAAVGVGVLGVGFFYRWAYQTSLAFPMPAYEVDGELIDCFFPLIGRCTFLECGLLYLDVFAITAVATWHALRRRIRGMG